MLTRCPSCNKILSGFFESKVNGSLSKPNKAPCPHCSTVLTYEKINYKRSKLFFFVPFASLLLILSFDFPNLLDLLILGVSFIGLALQYKFKPKLIIHSEDDNEKVPL